MSEVSSAPGTDEAEWGIVELFGHRRHVGRVREVQRFGTTMMQIEIPIGGAPEVKGWETILVGGSAIYAFRFCTEAAALQLNGARFSEVRQLAADMGDSDDSEQELPY